MSTGKNSKPLGKNATDKPIILALDTTTQRCSVSIARGSEIVVTVSSDKNVSHSSSLLEQIKSVIDKARVSIAEIDLYATASGPGSFTGMRVGISTVKGLSASMGASCVGVSSLKALACCVGPTDFACVVIQAGRNEVFSQVFRVDNEKNVYELGRPSSSSFSDLLKRMILFENVLWVGDAITKHSEEIEAFVKERGVEIFKNHKMGKGGGGFLQKGWVIAAPAKSVSEGVAYLAYGAYLNEEMVVSPEDLSAEYVRETEFKIKSVK
jgi:tRNA threonylcarbamoyladenosine biosynthesis protein TsaB